MKILISVFIGMTFVFVAENCHGYQTTSNALWTDRRLSGIGDLQLLYFLGVPLYTSSYGCMYYSVLLCEDNNERARDFCSNAQIL
jgi:hypothetical protein